MRTLYALRHAKSSWDEPALEDHERPLAPRGTRDAQRLAAHLPALGCDPELVLCSGAARTRETLDLVRSAFTAPDVHIEDELYGATVDALAARLRVVPATVGSVLLIGHNPGMQELVLLLAHSGEALDRVRTKFPTAALATLAIAGDWSGLAPGSAELTGYVTPKQLE